MGGAGWGISWVGISCYQIQISCFVIPTLLSLLSHPLQHICHGFPEQLKLSPPIVNLRQDWREMKETWSPACGNRGEINLIRRACEILIQSPFKPSNNLSCEEPLNIQFVQFVRFQKQAPFKSLVSSFAVYGLHIDLSWKEASKLIRDLMSKSFYNSKFVHHTNISIYLSVCLSIP